ncbi:MAG: ABC transporter ATP-binding protein [Gemmatimonadetes bacterium]|nr:ABC transporter ATP-binding protein [Gemmatimonadota bacterium]
MADRLDAILPAGEQVLVRVRGDLGADGGYADTWVAVTGNRAVVLTANGSAVDVPVERMRSVRTEPLVGGGRLEIERFGEPTVAVPYSGTEAAKFSEVARGLEQLRKGEQFLINPELERTRCSRCGLLLPEKNGLCPACVRKWSTIKRIAAYMAPYKGRAAALALASVVTTGAELAPPLITKRLVDEVLVPVGENPAPVDERLALLGILVLALVGIRIGSWAAEWVHGWIVAWLGAQATADIRSQLYRRLEMLSLQFYDKRRVGALMARVTRDSGRLQEFLVDGLPYLIINAMMMLGILGFLLWMSWELTLYTLLPVPLLMIWGAVFWQRMRRLFTQYSMVWSSLTDRTAETLNGIRVVKAFAQEERERRTFHKVNRRATEIGIRTSVNRTVFHATITFLTGFGVLIVWLFGGKQVLSDEMTLGTLLAFYSFMWMVYGPLEWFGQVNSWMTSAFAGAERVFEVIDTEPESYQDPKAKRMRNIEGRVTFRDVTFGYDKSKPVLHGINADVAPGEMIGLVGKSGVGKTTTINLIARFYDVDHGAIEIDGVDIRDINLRDLRRQIGIVLQEPVLFSGTIGENIGYGNPDANFEEIMRAARLANAHNFIMAKADGYETQVGEQGNNLSGGEKQRVAIARAMLHNPRILILDEATSSVDVDTEKQIQDALGRMVEGRTTFAIAHRLSTLRNADRLIVLDDGRIVQIGSHGELMSEKGAFRDLVELQKETSKIIAIPD